MKWIAIGLASAGLLMGSRFVYARLQENNPIQGFALAVVLGSFLYAGAFWLVSRLF